MAAIEAQFKYSYEYEGKTISFEKGERFLLIKKVNGDWWQVKRKYENGTFENIYVPANYMKEVEDEDIHSHTYQNMSDFQAEYQRAKESIKKKPNPPSAPAATAGTVPDTKGIGPPTNPKVRISPKLARTKSNSLERTLDGQKPNGGVATKSTFSSQSSEPEYAVPQSPVMNKKKCQETTVPTGGVITKEWQPGYSLPQNLKGRSVTLAEGEISSLDLGSRSTAGGPVSQDHTQRQQFQSLLNAQLGGVKPVCIPTPPGLQPLATGSQAQLGGLKPVCIPTPPGLQPPATGSQAKAVPPIKPKPKPLLTNPIPLQRPKSFCVDDEILTEPSTFTGGRGVLSPPIIDGRRSFKKMTGGIPNVGGTLQVIPQDAKLTSFMPPGSTSPTPTVPSPTSLPEGWSEHKTPEGKVFYYNCITKESRWTAPSGPPPNPPPPHPVETQSPSHQAGGGGSGSPSPKKANSPLKRVAPRGWTKEINPLSQTPIFTNSKTCEKWALASDEKGFFYYNIGTPSSRLLELPPVMDDTSEALYDHLTITTSKPKRERIHSDNPSEQQVESSITATAAAAATKGHPKLQASGSVPPGLNSSQQLDMWSSCMTTTFLHKHGYLQRKRVVDSNSKKVRNDKWNKVFLSLQANQLLFYADHRTKDLPGAKPLNTFNLLHSNICSINYKDKKKNVIQVSSSTGELFYLEADTPTMMNDWYSTIQTAIDQTNEDFKINPNKYSRVLSSDGSTDISPPSQPKFSHRKTSSTAALTKDIDDIELIEELSGAEKTIRIKGRLRNLIARRPQVETLKKTGIMQEPIFGCNLEALAAREHRVVPLFLEHLITHIEKTGLTVVGLYRLSGNASQVQKLRYLLEEKPLADLSSPEWSDINVVTGCLKLYFRELPDPLVPFRLYRNFIEAARAPPDKKLPILSNEINKLPDPHYRTMKVLMKHLGRVVEHGHVNKMLASNLGIVFGPTLMRPEHDSLEIASLMPVQNNIVETIIKEESIIFRK